MNRFIEGIRSRLSEKADHETALAAGYDPLNREQYRRFNRFRPEGPKRLFCYLPFNSLTFSFNGEVYVCSYNRDVELGHYPENSIHEIWEGEKARQLRQHMRHNDLSFGCRHCKFFFDKGKFSNLRPLVFDKYHGHTDGDHPRVFEFELSNTCNLECQMCHGEVSSSIRKNRDRLPPLVSPYDDAFVNQLREFIPTLKEAKFYGGEPLLIPIYYKIWDVVKELNPKLNMFVITNGTNWNDRIERLVNDLNFDVAVSIDAAEKELLERIRKNVVFEELMVNIKRFSEVCNRKGKHLSLSYTVQRDNWRQFPKMIELCNDVGAYIYVSYLERPRQFALAEMDRPDLMRIREEMEKYVPSARNAKERHNRNCFEDFKAYLDSYIGNEAERHYHEYEFSEEHRKEVGELRVGFLNSVTPAASEGHFRDWAEACYATDPTHETIFSKESFFNRVNEATSELTDEEVNILRGFMMATDFRQLLKGIASTDNAELVAKGRESLRAYRERQGTHA
ncbi:MAG: twitch domain-containing radical SAM protein [Flavobacteriales bacterium]|nr:twitch domain-containing radical SAM protein [Flavobacteriales bacterium]